MSKEKIAIIGGAGELGFGLALRWAGAGLDVVLGSRDEAKAKDAARRLRDCVVTSAAPPKEILVAGAENAAAVSDATFVVIAVPFAAQAAILKTIRGRLKNCIVVDATVPLATALGGKPTRLVGVWQGSAAEAARELIPAEIPVIAGFHNVSASALRDVPTALDCDVLICGDDGEAKERLFALVRLIEGLRPIDAGPLEMARVVEAITALLISLNRRHKAPHSGVRITGLGH